MAKSKTTPSNTQSKHLPFTFYFIPNHPNYISKLKLPMNLVKLCTDIQRHVELPIIKIVEEHLTKQKVRKNSKESKNKKVHNFKPRFQPMEHPLTSPTHADPKTDITTITQNMQQGLKKHMSTTATQYTQPILKATATQYTHPTFKTTATQYTLPKSLNHFFTWTKSQYLPLNTTAVRHQPTNHHTLKHTYTPTPLDIRHSSKHSSLSPSPLPTPQATTYLPYHIPSRPTHKSHTSITYQIPSTLAPQSSHSHHQQKPTYTPRKNQQSDDQNHTHQHHTTTTTPFPHHTSQTQPNVLQITAQT